MRMDDIVVQGVVPTPSLPVNLEVELKQFLSDAKHIGVPRSKTRCAEDIQVYVTQENIEVPFTNNKPGNISQKTNGYFS